MAVPLRRYAVSLVAGLVGLGFLLTADTALDYVVAAMILVLAVLSALETRRRSRAGDQASSRK